MSTAAPRRQWGFPMLTALLVGLLPAMAGAQACGAWDAVYAGDADDSGARVIAEFGRAEGSNPVAFTLTGVDGDDTRLWRHRSVAWCFLGAGGCHMNLRYADGTTADPLDASDNPQRLVFARAGRDPSGGQRYTLVISGLFNAFVDGQREDNRRRLAVERFDDGDDIVAAPEVFYFERCVEQ